MLWYELTWTTYCEIIRIRDGSIFMVFMGSPPPRIYIQLNESLLFYWNSKLKHPRKYIPTNKQKTYNPRKLAHTNLNDSTVITRSFYKSFTQCKPFIEIFLTPNLNPISDLYPYRDIFIMTWLTLKIMYTIMALN